MKPTLFKTIVATFLTTFFAGSAFADFTYRCKSDTQSACIREFKALDSGCCVKQNGDRDSSFSKPSQNCKINFNTASCSKSGFDGVMSCAFKSTVCSELSDIVTYSYPPGYSCKAGSTHQVVFMLAPKADDGFSIEADPERVATAPLFCVAKVTPTTGKTKNSPRDQHNDASDKNSAVP